MTTEKQKMYYVLGTGVGKAIAHLLLTYPDTASVTIADEKYSTACKIASRLNSLSGSKNRTICSAREFHIENGINRYELSNYDVLISAVPARYNLELAAQAINAGVNFCDLGGVTTMTRVIMKLDSAARNAGVSVIPDCGLMPGLGMIAGRQLMMSMETVDSVLVYVGGLPQRPEPPVYYQKFFDLTGLRHLCYDRFEILQDGEIIEADPFSYYETLNAPELTQFNTSFGSTIEAFASAGASICHETFQALGARNFREQTVRWPGFVDYVKNIPADEFEQTIAPQINIPVDHNHPDLVWMKVCVTGSENSMAMKRTMTLLDTYDPHTRLTAMQRTTGFTTAVIARMAAMGKTAKGALTPDCALEETDRIALLNELTPIFNSMTIT